MLLLTRFRTKAINFFLPRGFLTFACTPFILFFCLLKLFLTLSCNGVKKRFLLERPVIRFLKPTIFFLIAVLRARRMTQIPSLSLITFF